MKIHSVFHVSLLEPYTLSTIPNRVRPPPPAVAVDSNQEYEVEEILDSKRICKRLFYLVKWKGYDQCHNSWEPVSFLKHSSRLIDSFHSKYPNRLK